MRVCGVVLNLCCPQATASNSAESQIDYSSNKSKKVNVDRNYSPNPLKQFAISRLLCTFVLCLFCMFEPDVKRNNESAWLD